MALYTGAAYFHVEGERPPRLTGALQLTHEAAACLLQSCIIVDVDGAAIGLVAASIAEDSADGTRVLFSAEGTVEEVLAALDAHRKTI